MFAHLTTPALLLDKKKLTRNLERMKARAQSLAVELRPHGKTAKCVEVLKQAVFHPRAGITVSTVQEAEFYFAGGFRDLLYAVGIVPDKLPRLARLVQEGAAIKIVLDSLPLAQQVARQCEQLQTPFEVLIEIDCDGARCGLPPDSPDLLTIAEYLERNRWLSLAGVMTHAGAAYHCQDWDCVKKIARQERDAVVYASQRLRQKGFPCPIVSVGSTPTAMAVDHLEGVTEMRPGVYMFSDLFMVNLGIHRMEDIAISTLASVIAHRKDKGWLVVDAGWTALSLDRSTARQHTDYAFGQVCDESGVPIPGLLVLSVTQEHGIIGYRDGRPPDFRRFAIGSRVRILPNHACAMANGFTSYIVLDENNKIVAEWARCRGW